MIRGLSKTLTRETGSRENVSLLDTRDFDEGTISYRTPEPDEKFVLLLDTRDIGSECCLIFGHQRHWIRDIEKKRQIDSDYEDKQNKLE